MSGSTGLQGPFQEHTRVRNHRILNIENAGTSPGSPVVPELDAYVTDSGISSRVWCAWCVRWHSHGHCGHDKPLGAGNGHRVAHCHDPWSRYNATGYVLRESAGGTNDPTCDSSPSSADRAATRSTATTQQLATAPTSADAKPRQPHDHRHRPRRRPSAPLVVHRPSSMLMPTSRPPAATPATTTRSTPPNE